ncbi:MAG TPA: hypothetical protein VNA88_13540 [Candidatus Kapabacteria bacterium]|nr:hypothetical protein [Candidatus Kapabacteria bacterium]
MVSRYYSPSGSYRADRYLIAVLVASLVALVPAYVYAWITTHFALIWARAFWIVGFTVAVGVIARDAMHRGHVRHSIAAAVGGTIVAVVALFGSWAFWAAELIGIYGEEPISMFWFLLRPAELFAFMAEAYAYSGIDIMSYGARATIEGDLLLMIWIGEAAMLLIPAVVMTYRGVSRRPYCEACGQWCSDRLELVEIDAILTEQMRDMLEDGRIAEVAALPRHVPGETFWFSLYMSECAGCGGFTTLSVDETVLSIDDKGRGSKETKTIVENLILQSHEVEVVRELRAERLANISVASQDRSPVDVHSGTVGTNR